MNSHRRRSPSPPPSYSPIDPSPRPPQHRPVVSGIPSQGPAAAPWNTRSPNVLVIPPRHELHGSAEAPAYELAGSSPNQPLSPIPLSPSNRTSRASSISSNFGAAINSTSAYIHPNALSEAADADLTPWYRLDRVDSGNFSLEADALRSALKGFNTDESVLIQILAKLDPFRMRALRKCYNERHSRDLLEDIRKKTSGSFEQTLMAIVRTPLEEDVYALNKAIAGLGTNEKALDDILICRSNADLEAIKAGYQQRYSKSLAKEVREDLSGSVQYLYDQILKAQRPHSYEPADPVQTQQDVAVLYRVLYLGLFDANCMSDILVNRNDAQLRAILEEWKNKYRLSLDVAIIKSHKGHYGKALALFLQRAYNRPASDAVLLEESMAGLGTRDYLLLTRVVRAHWDDLYLQEVKRFYAMIYSNVNSSESGNLMLRIKGETSGDYRRLLLACIH